jgi:uncharacterized protein
MRLAAIGASGRIGRCIVQEALRRRHEVTAVVRGQSPVNLDGELRVARADVFEPATVATVVADSDVVVSAVGHAASLDDQSFYVRAARSLIEALRSLDTKRPRLIVVGGFGSLEVAPGSQLADAGGYPAKAAPEIVGQRDALTHYRGARDIAWTYFSPPPGGIKPGERTGSYRLAREGTFPGDPRDSRISIEDFAVALLDEAERAEHLFACITAAN